MKQKHWLDDTDAALHDAALRYTAERYGFEARQRLPAAERRFSAKVWADMGEMGWLAVASPEDDGGLGLRVASICLLAEAAGRALVTEPLTSSGVLAPHLVAAHGTPAQRAALLPRLHAGALPMACLLHSPAVTVHDGRLQGVHPVLIDADIAQQLVVHAGGALWLIDANARGVECRPFPLLDGAARRPCGSTAPKRSASAMAPPLASRRLCNWPRWPRPPTRSVRCRRRSN